MSSALLLTFKLTLLWLYFGKSCKTRLFRKPAEVFQNTPTFISIGPPITKWQLFRNMKNLSFFWRLLFLKKVTDIWNFQWIKYLGKGLSYVKTRGIGVDYCWNYGLSKLLLHFTEYRLDQLNSKRTKAAVSSTIQYFESCS